MKRKDQTRQQDGRNARHVKAIDVAKKLGISAMTVSRVMNNSSNVEEETRKRVLKTARQLGYSPNQIARSLVQRKSHTIGVVVPEITHSFFPEAIRGMEDVTYQAQYHLILTHSAENSEREKDALLTLEAKRVDGILISAAQDLADDELYKQVIGLGIPIVFFDRCIHGIGASCVSIDDEECAYLITRHLVDHGYSRLAHLSGSQKMSVGRLRLNGFRRALREKGFPSHNELIVEAGFQEADGYVAMKKLLDVPHPRRPRAVVAVNDPAAFGAFKAIREKGLRIPEDVALVGFSDDIRAELMPAPLTTICQPAYEIGRRAAQKLIDVVEGRSTSTEDIIIKAEMVIRRSCGCMIGRQHAGLAGKESEMKSLTIG